MGVEKNVSLERRLSFPEKELCFEDWVWKMLGIKAIGGDGTRKSRNN